MMRLVVLGLALGLAGCAPAVGAGIGLLAIVVLVGAAALVRSAGAGEAAPCSGSEETACNPQGYLNGEWRKVGFGGKVRERCVPAGVKAPLEAATYVTCADGSCAVGTERAACP